jgi:hypothetical protein
MILRIRRVKNGWVVIKDNGAEFVHTNASEVLESSITLIIDNVASMKSGDMLNVIINEEVPLPESGDTTQH